MSELTPAQRAVVWDLDGVIVDSAAAHNYSWTAMAAEFGVPYDPDRNFPAYSAGITLTS